jgi:hypothetical protein
VKSAGARPAAIGGATGKAVVGAKADNGPLPQTHRGGRGHDAFGNVQFLLLAGCGATRLFALIRGIETDRAVTFELGREVGTAGIPSAVILVRNANGSHNSDEALDREDFAGGVHVLGRVMHRLANAR